MSIDNAFLYFVVVFLKKSILEVLLFSKQRSVTELKGRKSFLKLISDPSGSLFHLLLPNIPTIFATRFFVLLSWSPVDFPLLRVITSFKKHLRCKTWYIFRISSSSLVDVVRLFIESQSLKFYVQSKDSAIDLTSLPRSFVH